MRSYFISVQAIVLIILISSCTSSKSEKIGESLGLNSILPENTAVEKLTVGYNFDTAGSPLYMDGQLYFTNNNFDSPDQLSRTFRMDEDGNVDTLITGNNVMTTLRASGNGTIYACEMLGHRVVELDQNGQIVRVVADAYNRVRIDGPNDLVVDQKGGIYFSDSQFIAGREIIQPEPAVYYVSSDSQIQKVIHDIEFPNGLALSPNGNVLYVANTQGTHILAYDVSENGAVSNGRNFAEVELAEDSEISGSDGMTTDSQGNLYVATTQGLGVQIFSPKGEYLGNINIPSVTNNVSFGGESGDVLYISAQDGIYSVKLNVTG